MVIPNIFVISDLHLGGSGKRELCPRASRQRLGRFIQGLTARPVGTVELVINGDFVDFLAVSPQGEAFLHREDEVIEQLKMAIATTDRDLSHDASVFGGL